jgi:hypothetical protein
VVRSAGVEDLCEAAVLVDEVLAGEAVEDDEPSPVLCALPLLGRMGAMSIRYDENTKARAVRLVREHRDDYDSEWAAMKAISGRLG